MRDYTRILDIPEMKHRKIKGHTRIELTKVATGEKKIIEHDNIFQSAIVAKQLRALGQANNNPFANSTWRDLPLYRNLCGGIFLFRDQIDTTGGDVEYMPAGNLMVANGAFATENNGTPQELGSFNSIESSFSGSSAVFVYDWGTSQGNGTISCVCLTSETGGYIGYGNNSGIAAAARVLTVNQSTSALSNAQWFYNGYKYKFSGFDPTTNKAKITKSIDGVTKTSLFLGVDGTEKEYTITGSPWYSGDSGYMYFAKQISETKIVLLPSTGRARAIASGATVYLMIYDCANDTISLQPIINTSGTSVDLLTSGNTSTASVNILGIDENGNIYFSPQYQKQGFIFAADGSFVARMPGEGNNSGCGSRIAPGLILRIDQNGYRLRMYDTSTGTDLPINGEMSSNYKTFDSYPQIDALGMIIQDYEAAPRLFKNPLYLATINNLENPVTKDSTQTMKVIYTLTEAS